MERPFDDEVLTLIRGSIRSIWTLELLLLLRRHRGREWREGDLVRELRGSREIVRNSLAELGRANLADTQPDGTIRAAYDGALDDAAHRLALAYEQTPAAVIKAIVTAPDDRSRFSPMLSACSRNEPMMGPSEGAVYLLCTATSGLCTWLLLRAYRRARTELLVWSALCFLLLTVNNALVFLDIIVFTQVDLSLLRFATSLAATCVLIYGFVWDL